MLLQFIESPPPHTHTLSFCILVIREFVSPARSLALSPSPRQLPRLKVRTQPGSSG